MRAVLVAAALALLLFAAPVVVRAEELGVDVVEAVDITGAHPNEAQDEAKRLEGMLHWAISNSDPQKLKELAEDVQLKGVVEDLKLTLEQKKARVQELSSIMANQLTETQLMQEMIAVLVNQTSTLLERLWALQALQELVEPIDNANDLKPLKGITAIVDHLSLSASNATAAPPEGSEGGAGGEEAPGEGELRDKPATHAEIQAAAAHVIATAASNNVKFQSDLMEAHPEIFSLLLLVASHEEEATAIKGVHALGNMVRNQQAARDAFSRAGGPATMQRLLLSAHSSTRLKRRALSLVLDLFELDPSLLMVAQGGSGGHEEDGAEGTGGAPGTTVQPGFVEAILALLKVDDFDVQEKCLLAMRYLLKLPGAGGASARTQLAGHGADAVLRQVSSQLQLAALEEEAEGGDERYAQALYNMAAEVAALLAPAHTLGGGRRGSGSGSDKTEL